MLSVEKREELDEILEELNLGQDNKLAMGLKVIVAASILFRFNESGTRADIIREALESEEF